MSSNIDQATPSEGPPAMPHETPSSTEPPHPEESAAAGAMKGMIEEGRHAIARAGHAIERPATGAVIAGTATIAAAVLLGAAEAAVGMGAALVVYRMLRRQRKLAREESREDYKHAA